MTARQFLHLLWGDKPKELYILVWTIENGNKLSHFRRHPDDAADVVEALSKRKTDIYMGVGLAPRDFGPHARCGAAEVAGITAVWMDIDLASEAHPNPDLPKTIEEALSILPAEMPPSLVVFTGNGVHVYWLFKELEVFASAEEREAAALTVRRWQTMLSNTARGRGWKIERLADLARVLRLPGTRNLKDPQKPKSVVVCQESDRRYNLTELNWFLDQMGIVDETPRPATMPGLVPADGKAAEAEFHVNLQATIPEATLAGWLETDLQFYKTWMRQRGKDFSDDSQHPYDLALANFALTIELSPQQTVDLIVHHRRLHRQRPRTRADYYERTMRRAQASGLPGNLHTPPPPLHKVAAAGATNGAPQAKPPIKDGPPVLTPTPTNGSEEDRPRPTSAKGVLTEWISGELGLTTPILRILKITGSEPTYQIEFSHDVRISLHDVNSLLDQNRLRSAIAASPLNHRIPSFKPAAWNLIVDRILEALTEIEGGSENELAGAVRSHLDRYLSTTRFANPNEDPSTHTDPLPHVADGQIAISTMHFQQHLDDRRIRLSIREITSALVALGAEQHRIRRKSRDLSRWLLPASDFPSSEYTCRPEESGQPERKPN